MCAVPFLLSPLSSAAPRGLQPTPVLSVSLPWPSHHKARPQPPPAACPPAILHTPPPHIHPSKQPSWSLRPETMAGSHDPGDAASLRGLAFLVAPNAFQPHRWAFCHGGPSPQHSDRPPWVLQASGGVAARSIGAPLLTPNETPPEPTCASTSPGTTPVGGPRPPYAQPSKWSLIPGARVVVSDPATRTLKLCPVRMAGEHHSGPCLPPGTPYFPQGPWPDLVP